MSGTIHETTSYAAARSIAEGLRLPDRNAAKRAVIIWLQNSVTKLTAHDPEAAPLIEGSDHFPVEYSGKRYETGYVKSATILSPTFVQAEVFFVDDEGQDLIAGVIQLLTFEVGGEEEPLDFDDDPRNLDWPDDELDEHDPEPVEDDGLSDEERYEMDSHDSEG